MPFLAVARLLGLVEIVNQKLCSYLVSVFKELHNKVLAVKKIVAKLSG
jgi:hypothetical protein